MVSDACYQCSAQLVGYPEIHPAHIKMLLQQSQRLSEGDLSGTLPKQWLITEK